MSEESSRSSSLDVLESHAELLPSTSFMEFLRGSTRLGISQTTPPQMVRYVVLGNIATYCVLALHLPYFPLLWKSGNPLWLAVIIGLFLILGASLWLRTRGRHYIATSLALLVAFAWTALCIPLFGTSQYPHFYFAAITIASFSLYPPQYSRSMWFVALSASLAFVWSVLSPPILGIIDLGKDAGIDRTISLIGFPAFLMIFGLYTRRTTLEAERKLEREHLRTEMLLNNSLPRTVVSRLKAGETSIADASGNVCVLLADVVGFTKLSIELTPQELVRVLGRLFQSFDELAERHSLEKIKTIGDAYLVVAGLPHEHSDPEGAMARMGLEMLKAAQRIAPAGRDSLSLRIGLHSGPAMAGVIGKSKFAYEIWGEALNIASEMESQSAAGIIQVSAAVKDRLAGRFNFEPRSKVVLREGTSVEAWSLVGENGS